ncbi:polysaccharide biosynthesis tyrosine autokinase [Desulfosporosinus sp. OT]|uniref:polysaccharide biosynthesis tyrosine autokinase n=1 Tax=Desulfosporosinus sp. OT TaxID=913865 RepID=UPI000223A92E|nr:polysaccharide biosynthesis tyrosine autokinase [Desulfosporosinus sp. OT]EGW38464.1 capsular exopolysaccharide family domain protein [Desulfosporosinus sp. OT]
MESEKDLGFYGKALKRRWAIILILPIITATASGILGYYFKEKPIYLASTTLVMGKPVETSTNNQDVNAILASPQMAKIFEPIVKSWNVEEKVINHLNLPLSVTQLDSKVTVNSEEGSDLIEISVRDPDAKVAADIANALAEKFSEVVVKIKKVNTVSILDRAVIPDAPVIADNRQIILIAYFSGLMASLALAFLLEYRDNTLKSSEDIQKILNLSVMGKVPYGPKIKISEVASSLENNSLWALSKKKSRVAEAYSTLRTNIQFLNSDGVKKRILITSTSHREGKSLITVNLAASLVHTGKRVLIIDANLRNPIQHDLFEFTSEEGLSNILVSQSPSLDQITQTRIQGLDVITAGPIPPNPTELLASENMKSILTAAAEIYDVVIIDSPPAMAIADVSVLAQEVDGVLLVVGSGEVSQEYVLEAKEQLEKVGAKIIGVVLNKVTLKTKDYKYYNRFYKASKRWKKRIKRSNNQNQSSKYTA